MRFSLLALVAWVLIVSGLIGCGAASLYVVSEHNEYRRFERARAAEYASPEERRKTAQAVQDNDSWSRSAGLGGTASFSIGCGLLILNWRQMRREKMAKDDLAKQRK